MNRENGLSGPYAILIGIFLLIEGCWGEMSDVVFGALTTNRIHATIHILLGICGIWTGLKGGARGFCMFIGALLIAVGVLRFIPGAGELVVSILNVHPNIVAGIVSLIVAFASRPRR